MKKHLIVLLICLLSLSSPCHSQSLDEMQQDFDRTVGVCASDGMATAIGASMMGWGLAIIVGISILSIVLHQSSNNHSPTTSQGGTGNSSTGGAAGSGVGSVI